MVWVVSRFSLKAPPGISSSSTSPLTSSGQRSRVSLASQPQMSATLSPQPGGKPRKFITTCGGIGKEDNYTYKNVTDFVEHNIPWEADGCFKCKGILCFLQKAYFLNEFRRMPPTPNSPYTVGPSPRAQPETNHTGLIFIWCRNVLYAGTGALHYANSDLETACWSVSVFRWSEGSWKEISWDRKPIWLDARCLLLKSTSSSVTTLCFSLWLLPTTSFIITCSKVDAVRRSTFPSGRPHKKGLMD